MARKLQSAAPGRAKRPARRDGGEAAPDEELLPASEVPVVDHYEVLQVSQNADAETIERVYRLLAKRYHPDNSATGDEERFLEVRAAYEVLSDPERRARFDVHYDEQKTLQWQIFEQGAATSGREDDRRTFHGVLSLLYAARRRDPEGGGLGSVHLERMLGVPREHLEFPVWYLRKRGWVEILPTGQLAITVDGIDKLTEDIRSLSDDRLLSGPDLANGNGTEPRGIHLGLAAGSG